MSLAHRAAKRLIGPVLWRETYRCMRLSWQQAAAAAGVASPPSVPVEVRPLERAELRRYCERAEYGISAQFLDGIAERDDLCFGAFAAGELAAYRFFALRPTAINRHLRFRFPSRWIYAYKAFTLPAWRGRRLHRELFARSLPAVSHWVLGLQEPLGFVTLVLSKNFSSAAALARLGFAPCESFAVLTVLGRPRFVSPSADEAAGFSIELSEPARG